MSTPAPPPRLDQHPAVRNYSLLCLTALLGILLALLPSGPNLWTLLPVLVGAVGLVFPVRQIPLLLLLALIFTVVEPTRLFSTRWPVEYAHPLTDLALGGAVLLYVAAQYRLQGLISHIVPLDPRRGKSGQRGPAPTTLGWTRSPQGVTLAEVPLLLIAVVVWVVLAQIVWDGLPAGRNDLGLRPYIWRTIVLCWLVAGSVFVVASIIDQLRRRRLTHDEALMLLQDSVWQETRREQRRINRWRAWTRVRRQRREERG